MFQKRLAISFAVLILTACGSGGRDDGKKGGDDTTDPSAYPTEAAFTLPPAREFTEQEKRDFADLRAEINPAQIADLVFVPENESAEERRARENERGQAKPVIRNQIARAERDCGIKHPRASKTGSGSLGQVGATQLETTEASIGGANCPIEGRQGSATRLTITKVDANAGYLTAKVESTLSKFTRLKDPALTAEFDVLESKLSIGGTGGYLYYGHSGDSRAKMDSTLEGVLSLKNGERLTLNGTFSVVTTKRGSSSRSQTAYQITVRYRQSSFLISMRTQVENGVSTTETYLNGKRLTEGAPLPFPLTR